MTTPLRPPALALPDEGSVRWTSFTKVIRDPEANWPAQICGRPIIARVVSGRSIALVADPQAAGTILTGSEAEFPKWRIYQRVVGRGAGRLNLSATEGEENRRHRRALAPGFHPERVKTLAPVFAAVAGRAIEEWRSHGGEVRIDAWLEMTRMTLSSIWAAMHASADARPDAEVDRIARLIHEAALRGDINDPAELLSGLAELPGGTPDPGLLPDSPLRPGDPHEALSPAERRDNLRLLLKAGHETTALTLTWALWLIGQDAQTQRRLHAEIDEVAKGGPIGLEHLDRLAFTGQVLRETMRLYSPTPLVVRQSTREVEIAGERLPAGSILAVCIYALHRHEALWDDPSAFRPERFARGSAEPRHRYAFLPFGAGAHVCIGSAFAWTEAMIILAKVLQAFEVSADPSVRIQPKVAITLRPDRSVPIVLRPRRPSGPAQGREGKTPWVAMQ